VFGYKIELIKGQLKAEQQLEETQRMLHILDKHKRSERKQSKGNSKMQTNTQKSKPN